MFGFSSGETRQRFPELHLGIFFLCVALSGTALAQGDPEVVWQTDNGSKAVAFSTDGQLLLAGTRLFAAANGTLIRTFVLPYNGGGVTAVALSADGQYAAIGIQGFNQNLDFFRVSEAFLIKDGSRRTVTAPPRWRFPRMASFWLPGAATARPSSGICQT